MYKDKASEEGLNAVGGRLGDLIWGPSPSVVEMASGSPIPTPLLHPQGSQTVVLKLCPLDSSIGIPLVLVRNVEPQIPPGLPKSAALRLGLAFCVLIIPAVD